MECELKTALVTRLQFVLAELEVAGQLVLGNEDPVLQDQIQMLGERVRECIDGLLHECPPRMTT